MYFIVWLLIGVVGFTDDDERRMHRSTSVPIVHVPAA